MTTPLTVKPCDYCGVDCLEGPRNKWCNWKQSSDAGSYHHECAREYILNEDEHETHEKYCHKDGCTEFPMPIRFRDKQ